MFDQKSLAPSYENKEHAYSAASLILECNLQFFIIIIRCNIDKDNEHTYQSLLCTNNKYLRQNKTKEIISRFSGS